MPLPLAVPALGFGLQHRGAFHRTTAQAVRLGPHSSVDAVRGARAGLGSQFAAGGKASGTNRSAHHHRNRGGSLGRGAGRGEPRKFVRADAGRVHDARPGTRLLDLRAHRAGYLQLVRRAPRYRAGDRDGRAVARRDGDGAAGRLCDREMGMARRGAGACGADVRSRHAMVLALVRSHPPEAHARTPEMRPRRPRPQVAATSSRTFRGWRWPRRCARGRSG